MMLGMAGGAMTCQECGAPTGPVMLVSEPVIEGGGGSYSNAETQTFTFAQTVAMGFRCENGHVCQGAVMADA